MRVKTFLFLFLAFQIAQVFGFEDICENPGELEKMAKSLSYPNCLQESYKKSFLEGDIGSTCLDCKKQFELILGRNIPEDKKTLQENFFDNSLMEYKKNLINNVVNAVKMNVLPNTGSAFKASIAACNMNNFKDLAKTCKSPRAKEFLLDPKKFQDLSALLANDIAKIISTDQSFKIKSEESILKRGEPACFIPEKDVISLTASASEEMLNEKLVEIIKHFDPKKFSSISEMFESDEIYDAFGDLSELKQSLESHPYISGFMQSPEKFITFLKEVPTPTNIVNLRKKIYSPENAEKYDQEMASRCNDSFKKFSEVVCNDDFESGNLSLEIKSNIKKLDLSSFPTSNNELSSTNELISNNLKYLQLCIPPKPNALSLTSTNDKISNLLSEKQKKQSLHSFGEQKHSSEIGLFTDMLCKMKDDQCVEGTIVCAVYKKYKNPDKKNSLESKLASSSNAEVNALLRSMIGDTSKVDTKTKEILVANGILPKADGTIVAQPTIPERKPDYFATVPQPAAAFAPATSRPSSAQNSARPAYEGPDYTQTSFQNLKSPSNVDFKDLIDDSTQDLKDIQDEIRRRLTDLGPSKVNKEQAKKIVKESFAASGKMPTPVQENNYTTRIMNSMAAAAPASDSELQPAPVAAIASPEATGSAAAKWRNEQKNAALAGMQGAQQVTAGQIAAEAAAAAAGAAGADSAAAKPLTNVALSIAEDPRVSLSDVLTDKINRNDSETQLLKVLVRNKQPFMLTVKSLNFKVIFDNNQPKILLESGDKKEAERLRPQLELFFNKLRSNSIYVIR